MKLLELYQLVKPIKGKGQFIMGNIITFTEEDQKNYLKSKEHKENLKIIANIRDEDIDYSDIPEIDEEFLKHAKIIYPKHKKRITIRIDEDVLAYYKSLGSGYQTKINAILKYYAEHHNLIT